MAETVLIVEDDRDIVELLSLYLTGSGYDVVTAGNGEDALEQLRQHPADIALVDIMMPRMNGYDFIKALRATDNIPVIIISARTQAADKIVGLDAGADGFIAKPFNPLEVTAQIRALLRRRATDVADALANPSDHIESRDFFSWERFFTAFLVGKTRGTYLQYEKRALNPAYLQDREMGAIKGEMPKDIGVSL